MCLLWSAKLHCTVLGHSLAIPCKPTVLQDFHSYLCTQWKKLSILACCVSADLFNNLLFKTAYSFLHIYTPSSASSPISGRDGCNWEFEQIFPQNPYAPNKEFQIPLGDSHIQNFSTETFSVAKHKQSFRSCSVSLCVKFPVAERRVWNMFVNASGILKNISKKRQGKKMRK